MKLLRLWILLSSIITLWKHVQAQRTESLTSDAGIYFDEAGPFPFTL